MFSHVYVFRSPLLGASFLFKIPFFQRIPLLSILPIAPQQVLMPLLHLTHRRLAPAQRVRNILLAQMEYRLQCSRYQSPRIAHLPVLMATKQVLQSQPQNRQNKLNNLTIRPFHNLSSFIYYLLSVIYYPKKPRCPNSTGSQTKQID